MKAKHVHAKDETYKLYMKKRLNYFIYNEVHNDSKLTNFQRAGELYFD